MIRAYTIASGKGGTGKTTVTINLGAALAKLGLETYIMDADIGMANIGLLLGLEDAPVTIHEVLAGTASLDEAIYDGPNGVKVLPSGISLQGFQHANPDRFRDILHELVNRCDYLLIDSPAGISRDGVIPLAIADEVILVVNPEVSSIVDALKTKVLTEVVGGHVCCAILNRAGSEHTSLIQSKLEKTLGVKLVGVVPEDPNVRVAAVYKTPVVMKFPGTEASRAFRRIAANIAGIALDEGAETSTEGFVSRFVKILFRGKK
ncbi:MAG: cell division ATPase MinD [Methanomicrobiales archaeon]|nr:cell division ATPase MinD [Methanomicrobiales archaeon]